MDITEIQAVLQRLGERVPPASNLILWAGVGNQLDDFERMVQEALPYASKYDFHPVILKHLQELKNRLSKL